MAKKKESNKEKAAKAIARLWGGIEDDQFDLLLEHIELTKFKKGELIYKNEEHPAKAMCLLTGKVKIFKDGISGKNQIIRVIKPLEFFGFRAYFADEIYKTAAMSLDNCVVAQFPFAVLMKMLQKSFNIGHYFIKYLSIEIGKSDDRTVNLTQKHIRGRLAETLLMLKDEYGTESTKGAVCLSMSREDLACFSNMTTSNAIRTLSAFASEKLVDIDRRKITILKETELANISKMG